MKTLLLALLLAVPVRAGEAPADDDAVAEVPDGQALPERPMKKKPKKKESATTRTEPDARPAPIRRPSDTTTRRLPTPSERGPSADKGDRVAAPAPRLPTATRREPYTTPHPQSHSAVQRVERETASLERRALRSFDGDDARSSGPAYQTEDHRWARPNPRYVTGHHHPDAVYPPPHDHYYWPRYSHWWVHPWYRHYHVTWVVVWFPFETHPWAAWWAPPVRPGWVWVPGYWSYGYWVPGYWAPVHRPPVVHGVSYVYVPGWWYGDVYIEGYWRPTHRPNADWVWVDGHYTADGTYVPGYWRPAWRGPEGYVWEPGFFDGEVWVGGFWRPEVYPGYLWVSAYYDRQGVYHSGYWEPRRDRPGHVWIPGWFDGNGWVAGYWVDEAEYEQADTRAWRPAEGWNEGWDEPAVEVEEAEALPLALPVNAD